MTIILDTIARHLDNLPLGQIHRARIYQAWEIAPDAPLDFDADSDDYGDYLKSDAGVAWRQVRDLRLYNPESRTAYATTLEEMSFYVSAPTKTDILKALARADHQLNGVHA